MRADLEKTSDFYRSDINYTLNSEFFKWEEFDVFQDALWNVERATQLINPGTQVQYLLEVSRKVKLILSKSPLGPNLVDEIQLLLDFDLENTADSELHLKVLALLESAKLLLDSENPMALPAINLIAKDVGKSNGNGDVVSDVVLIVDRNAKSAIIEKWLPCHELQADVHTAKEVRDKAPWGTAILFGLPELHIRQMGFQEVEVKKPSNWLINAPAGVNLQVFLTEGSRTFDSKRYAPWPGAQVPGSVCTPLNRTQIRSEIIPQWIPDAPTNPGGPADPNSELVAARPILLPDNYWIYFGLSAGKGPKPLVTTVNDFEVSSEYVDINQLIKGDFLVIKSAKASRDFLRTQARDYIDRKYSGSSADADFEFLDEFKQHVQEFSLNEFAVNNMIAAGFQRVDARHRLNQAWDDEAIAPNSESDFNKLCKAVGYKNAKDAWPSLLRIRTAMRQAGRIAMRELISALKEDKDWPEIVENGEMCVVSSEDFGEIHVAKVVEIAEKTQELHLSTLGRLINPDGSIYEGDDV